jgi:hypothetical protein
MEITKFKIFRILQNKKYLAIMVVSSLAVSVLFPIIQSLANGGLQNLDLWFEVIPPINLILLIVFSLLFGMLLALQIYNLKIKTCSTNKKATSASSSGIGAFIAMVVPACPACISLATFFLPAATAISFGYFVVKFDVLLLLFSISLLVLGLFLLGGFKKEA